jgi:formylglycine-generating enzyme required for sulfatase activity
MKLIHLNKLILLAALWLCGLPVLAANRLALVIGNAAYEVGQLSNPVNDANAVAAKLEGLGFTVQKVVNLKKDDIGQTLNRFIGRIQPGDEVVFFYAGHGMQIDGVNYFPVVDAKIHSKHDAQYNSLSLNTLLQQLDASKAGVKLLFLDACRDNPFVTKLKATDRSTRRGLAAMGVPTQGTLIHFATEQGGVADDGNAANGLYTSVLLRYLDTPGIAVETMIKRVTEGVDSEARKRGKNQVPWWEGNLRGEFYFKPAGPVLTAEQIERQTWEEVLTIHSVAGYDAYLKKYPQGAFAGLASAKRLKLLPAVPVPVTAPVPVQKLPEKDCDVCPEMVMIPGGSFMMGDNSGKYSDEMPVHRVTVRSFMLGKTEVTQAQWQAIMGNNPSRFKDCGGNCPVEQVSWDDAQEFIKKLNVRSGKTYRLPSEAEWEYAARAGTTTAYPWGQQASHEYANYGKDECCVGLAGGRDKWVNTALVASFPANQFGVHDMHGNVQEWVEDCWHDNYNGAPTDGSVWVKGCRKYIRRVLRGGSWGGNPAYLRSANRSNIVPSNRFDYVGLRVAWTPP